MKVFVLAGTRPEAIKMVPVIRALRRRPEIFNVHVCASGQHREMLKQAFADFEVTADSNLDIMESNQTLAGMSARLFERVDDILAREEPDIVLVQGDTTTVQVSALSAFYRHIPVGHVEAGLRSHTIFQPFPEELNRRVTSLVATWHFAPTELSRQNLLREKVEENSILVTGNTVIDALFWIRDKVVECCPDIPIDVMQSIAERRRIILVTAHRRESFGERFENICAALSQIAEQFPEDRIVYPVHMNPNVRSVVKSRLAHCKGIILIDPLPYKAFVRLMHESYIILTDSGGIQEEGPSLGKPVLVMRELTERPEGVLSGVNILVGTDVQVIVDTASRLLRDDTSYAAIASVDNPYGDGMAGERIADFLAKKVL
jgi:UDP-N-acetylglucosamine 2-epimerase